MLSYSRVVLFLAFLGFLAALPVSNAVAQGSGWICTFGPACHNDPLPRVDDVPFLVPQAQVKRCQPGFRDQLACARDPNPGGCLGERMKKCIEKYCLTLIPVEVDLQMCVMVTTYPPGFLPADAGF